MKLQEKTMLIITITWVIICIIVFLDSKWVVAENYQYLESKIIQHQMEDTKRAYHNVIDNLALYSVPFSQWDDAYHFMDVKNNAFIKSNFTGGTFASSKLNFMMYFTTKGELYYGQSYNLMKNKFVPIPKQLLSYLGNHQAFIKQEAISSSHAGVISTKDGLIVMSSQPVLTSDGLGPIKGSLLTGYYVNEDFFENLSKLSGMKLQFFPIKALSKEQQLLEKDMSTAIVNSKLLYGYLVLKDIDGHPVGVIRIDIPRTVYQEGLSTAYHYIAIVFVLGFIVMLLMWFLLKVFVLERVISISNQVRKINQETNYDTAIIIAGNDEVSDMVRSINNMMSIILDSRNRLRYMALYDSLTQIPNRIYYNDLLNQALINAANTKTYLAVLFLDMDKLKKINDQYGHAIGDKVIKMASERMKASIRETDVVARLSGDEFAIFIRDFKTMNVVTETATRIISATSKPFIMGETHISTSFSIGISIYPIDGSTAEELLKKADEAMYAAKMKLGNNFQFYDNDTSSLIC